MNAAELVAVHPTRKLFENALVDDGDNEQTEECGRFWETKKKTVPLDDFYKAANLPSFLITTLSISRMSSKKTRPSSPPFFKRRPLENRSTLPGPPV